MAKLVAYCRVSGDRQKDNTSLPMQLERIDLFCRSMGHEIVRTINEIETASGKRRRPEFEHALDLIYKGEADGLVVFRLDRFARSVLHGLQIALELKKEGKHLVMVENQFDTSTPMGQFFLTQLLAFAELERELIGQRCWSGRLVKREKGGYWGGRPRYGVKAVGKELAWDLHELEQIEKMRLWYAEGKTFKWIQDELNRQQIPSKTGGQWSIASVWRAVKGGGLEDELQRKTAI